ncbi:4Fe-4S binding protein [Runella salmonicolor]|uniref:4Fe-4S dicluster domain-containing protein n=1 Tax=Runella salmonicolor TaxID=2950278 RepID=A0ABT1FVW3_9BACT|nr:4Fe-4S binding protein [Runella salmonicolor]MCP1384913.1 4Fe-4S dicluster domain-containing protein [Runella salmonicolor]
MNAYFQHINEGIRTTLAGMKLTLRHLWDARKRRGNHSIRENDYFQEQTGMVTLQYPFETMPIPDNGRYRLHNEMDDCIVCDKCAKVCPVDCIDIEPIKATEEVGKASDGSPIRLYAAVFDIDMAKCCYCGLCTTVCPTECLTMTKTFDYSEFDVRDMNYHYSNLTPELAAEKKSLYEQFLLEKEELKKQKASPQPAEAIAIPTAKPKPAFAPKKPVSESPQAEVESAENSEIAPKPKPVFAPKKPVSESTTSAENSEVASKPKPVFTPKKPVIESTTSAENSEVAPKPKPVFKPKKPVVDDSTATAENATSTENSEPIARPKPVFTPKKPVTSTVENQEPAIEKAANNEPKEEVSGAPEATPKPVFKPKKPVIEGSQAQATVDSAPANDVAPFKPKPVFVPKKPTAPSAEESVAPHISESETPETKNIDSDGVKPKPKPIFKPTMRQKKEE